MTTERFAGLSRRLLRAGVAPRHVKRLIAELEAHFADLVAELQSTGLSPAECESRAAVRLGTEDAVAANILARPELQSWTRQWPWLAFVLLPLLALPLQFVLSMLAALGVFNFSTRVLGLTALNPGAVPWVVGALQTYGVWIAPILAAGAACFLAARRGRPRALAHRRQRSDRACRCINERELRVVARGPARSAVRRHRDSVPRRRARDESSRNLHATDHFSPLPVVKAQDGEHRESNTLRIAT